MKLSKFDLDNKMSIAEMKQIKAGSITTKSNGNECISNEGADTDVNGTITDSGR